MSVNGENQRQHALFRLQDPKVQFFERPKFQPYENQAITNRNEGCCKALVLSPASGTSDAQGQSMIEAITDFFERKSKTKSRPAMVRLAPKPARRPEPESRGQQFGFSKVFRWPVPAEQTPKPTTVEVAGSFSEWRKLPLSYDAPTKTWQLIQRDIPGNHTHRYAILVDGNPTYDKTCDGLTPPLSPEEARWQIATPKGPRVMLLFSQTK